MSWLTGAGSALSGFVSFGENLGTSLVSAGSKAISATPQFLGNVVAKAQTLVPFNLNGSTQTANNLNPSISKSPKNPFTTLVNFAKGGFVSVGSAVAQSVNVERPTGLTGTIEAVTNFLNKTTSAISAVGNLKNTASTVFGGAGQVRDTSTGNLPSNFLFNLPSSLWSALGGKDLPAQSPAGYIPSTTDPLTGSSGLPTTTPAGLSTNAVLVGLGIVAVLALLMHRGR